MVEECFSQRVAEIESRPSIWPSSVVTPRSSAEHQVRLYTAFLNTRTSRVNIVTTVHRERVRSQHAETLLHFLHAAVRVDPRVLRVQQRRRRWVIGLLQAIEIIRSIRSRPFVARLENVRPLVHFTWYYVGIVVGHIVDHLPFRLVPGLLARRRHRYPVLFVAKLGHFGVGFHWSHGMATAIEGQRYPDNQNACGCYSAGEASHQEAVVGVVVGCSTIWEQRET